MPKVIRLIEILISIKFFRRGNKVFQHFIYGNQKNVKFILDSRYTTYEVFKSKLIENSLSRDPEISFLERKDLEGEIVLIYESEKTFLPQNYYFKVIDFVPPNAGCKYCIFRDTKVDEKTEELKIICRFKNNLILNKELINCKVFRQKRIYKT